MKRSGEHRFSHVADTAGVPDFRETGPLAPNGEQSFIMTRTGTTTFHCTIHASMVGTLEGPGALTAAAVVHRRLLSTDLRSLRRRRMDNNAVFARR